MRNRPVLVVECNPNESPCWPKEQHLMLTGGGELTLINSRGEYLLDENQGRQEQCLLGQPTGAKIRGK